MVYDSDYREVVVTSVDTAYPMIEQGADSPGAFIVPPTARRITEILIGLGSIATDVITGTTSGIKLSGVGLPTIGVGWFAGPMIAQAGASAKDGGFVQGPLMRYKTNIPVNPGAEFDADFYMHGEDPGLCHGLLQIVYDSIPGRIVDADYREESLATANTLVTLGNRGAAASGDFKPLGKTIGEVIFGAITDPVGDDAAGLLLAPALHLTGPGLSIAGNYKFIGPCGAQHPDTDISGDAAMANPERHICDIKTKRAGTIRAQAMNIESTIALHAICGLCYI